MSKKGIAVVMREHIRTLITEDGADHPPSKSELAVNDGILKAFMNGKICMCWDPEESCLTYRAVQCKEKKR